MKIERFHDGVVDGRNDHATNVFETTDQVAFKNAFHDTLVAYEEWEKLKDDPSKRNLSEKIVIAFQKASSLGGDESIEAQRSVSEIESRLMGKQGPSVEQNAGYDASAMRDSFFHR